MSLIDSSIKSLIEFIKKFLRFNKKFLRFNRLIDSLLEGLIKILIEFNRKPNKEFNRVY